MHGLPQIPFPMNHILLAAELAGVLVDDAEVAVLFTAAPAAVGEPPVVNIYGEQSGFIVTARPSLVISGDYQAYGARRLGTLSLEVRSRIGAADNHAAAVETVWNKLLGAPGADYAATLASRAAVKAAVQAALLAAGKVELIEYGPAPDVRSADAEGDDLRTILSLRVVWRFLPV